MGAFPASRVDDKCWFTRTNMYILRGCHPQNTLWVGDLVSPLGTEIISEIRIHCTQRVFARVSNWDDNEPASNKNVWLIQEHLVPDFVRLPASNLWGRYRTFLVPDPKTESLYCGRVPVIPTLTAYLLDGLLTDTLLTFEAQLLGNSLGTPELPCTDGSSGARSTKICLPGLRFRSWMILRVRKRDD